MNFLSPIWSIFIIISLQAIPMRIDEIEFMRNIYRYQLQQEKKALQEYIRSKKNPNIKVSFDRSDFKKYPLAIAVEEGYVDELLQLLEQGADPNLDNPLQEIFYGYGKKINEEHYHCAFLLLEYGGDPNKYKYNEYKQIIDDPILINEINKKGTTLYDALGFKYSNKYYQEFIASLALKANPYLKSKSGSNSIELTQARIDNNESIVEKKFFTSLLQKLQSITFTPKSLKELCIRVVLKHNLDITSDQLIPRELQEELLDYSRRKDMIHILKKHDDTEHV